MNGVPVLLVTHPGLAEGLLQAASAIYGDLGGRIDLLSNEAARGSLEDAIGAWIDAHPGPAVVFSDLSHGSCCNCARLVTRDRADVGILSGVNLPMILAVLQAREHESLGALLDHVRERGRLEIQAYLDGDCR